MTAITRVTTEEELSQIFVETFFNKQNKVTKVSKHSVMSALSFVNGKISQKAVKDVANIEANIFPDAAYGDKLDYIASNYGIAPRFGAATGTTFLRVVGDVGTTYTAGVHTFTGSHGVVFNVVNTLTITNVDGYDYVEVVSADSGLYVNVDPLTINKVSPVPSGHKYVVNEYKVLGGRDSESDDLFRHRIKNTPNINAQKTIAFFEQLFMTINNSVLRVFNYGTQSGKTVLALATYNGTTLTQLQLDTLFNAVKDYFAITDLKPFGSDYYGVKLQNVTYTPIDLDFRVRLDQSVDIDNFRIKIQVALQKKIDYKNWYSGVIAWDTFFGIVKNTYGASYVPRQYFFINGNTVDYNILDNELPCLRSFIMRDESGNIISNQSGTMQPFYYPNEKDKVATSSIL